MSRIKDALYNYFVRKNGRVWYEYERYVREHLEEHKTNKVGHILLLLKLNWFYRVKKGETPYLYWDAPMNQIDDTKLGFDRSTRFYPESQVEKRESMDLMVEKLAQYDVICVDVFDTLIFRAVNKAEDVFEILGAKKGLQNFKIVRKNAIENARKLTGKFDVCLNEIYEEIYSYYGKRVVPKEELELEKKITYANPYMLEVVKKLQLLEKKIIAVSDMYFNSKEILEILEEAGYSNIEVFSSADYGRNKQTGELQRYVMTKCGESLSYIFVGDNYQSDFIKSKEVGMDAYWYKNCLDIGDRYRSNVDNSIAGKIYRGIVNNKLHNGTFNGNCFYEHGYTYGGYIVLGFCRWINQLALKHNYDKFLFLARDMEVFYKVYNKLDNSIDNRYVEFSRFASQQLIFDLFPGEYFEYTIETRIKKNTINEVLSIYDLPKFEKELKEFNLNGDEKLDEDNYLLLKKLMLKYRDKIKEHFSDAMAGARAYYKDLVGDSKNVCILDLGWKGTAVVYLKALFEKWGIKADVHGAIVSVSGNSYAKSICDMGLIHTYMRREDMNFTAGVPKNANFEAFRGHLFEATFTSAKSSLLEYTTKEKFIYARENPNSEIVKDIQQGIIDFCEEYRARIKGWGEEYQITGLSANTPINKALKEKGYVIPVWGEIMDEASAESGFVKESKMKSFFAFMVSTNCATEKEYGKYYQYKDESDNIFICSTYSQVFITLVKVFSEKITNVDILLYDDIPNCPKLRESLKKTKLFKNIVIFSKEGLPPRFHKEEKRAGVLLEYHKLHMIKVERKLQVQLERYKDIYVYYDGHHIGLYLQEKHIKYHLIEDGMNHFQHIYATPSAQEIPVLNKQNLLGYQRGYMYLCCGQNPDCISLEVNENKDLALTHPNVVENPRSEMIKRLSDTQKKVIYDVFLSEMKQLENTKNDLAIVFTSVLVNDGWVDSEATQIKIYRDIVNELKKEGYFVVIKPHPRDKIIYNKQFQDCLIIDRAFPSEILDFNKKIKIKKGVVIASSAMELLSCIEHKEKLGFKFFNNYREHVAPWVIESLEHPERYNW
ncbi:polysialyltransferase family glycosyltransferase [Eubacterium oxidoreducens]|uniref:Haloacid dehalogenase-like hydrolase n=1 Tax=Eubacterium oxidoreducens TaxID=1732 RepID=A0A1G6CBB1_EUBOX|nr:polysialyltransferase family glycosyltransferase [Eubacterium oxidoreducens]SDB30188.1 hypothetical protein SAMN02910417_02259 [Eubacterium oxidoreducens]